MVAREKIQYGTKVHTEMGYEEAVERTREALRAEGFGVLTEIDVKSTMKAKLGAEFKRYVILGACNPELAHSALSSEEDLGLLLPCNVIVYEDGAGAVVATLDPGLMAQVTGNAALEDVASKASAALGRMLAAVEAA